MESDDLGNLIGGACCIGGDFNEVLYSEDRNGRKISNVERVKSHEWVTEVGLIDIHSKYSGIHGPIYRKHSVYKTRSILFALMEDQFPTVSLRGLPRPVSDHCPLVLDKDQLKGHPQSFRLKTCVQDTIFLSKTPRFGGESSHSQSLVGFATSKLD